MYYKKLLKQPLKFVLAEFKFSPVLQIHKFIPDVQESFRKKYPILEKKIDRVISLSDNNDVVLDQIDRWSFIASDRKQAIELNQEKMIYFLSNYDRFDGFSSSCEDALKILSEIIEPSLIERIGLRYSDLVLLDNNEKIDDLINSNFIYPTNLSELGSNHQQKTEVLLQTNAGQLAIRTLYGTHGLTYLSDLHNRLPILIQMENTPSERIILDFDHFWEAGDDTLKFNDKNIIAKLDNLHEIARDAFWKITSDYARSEKWA